ncbi:cytochrome-c peroxidase [Xanthomonas sacchari]|uniref:cytochrome-c peroxidase n=1 Tax=Xanthomonas sacchari TaxID=56458 RepID=UPI0022590454|nr:cytochrome c peroxidase [Xanthomonas sacchari]
MRHIPCSVHVASFGDAIPVPRRRYTRFWTKVSPHVRRIVWIGLFAATLIGLGSVAVAVSSLDRQRHRQALLAKVALGRTVFHDAALSASGELACATCHRPDAAFAQPIPVPYLGDGRSGTRNVPSLLDLKYFDRFFWDGREDRIDRAAVAAFTNRAEMAQPDMAAVVAALRGRPAYGQRFKAAFGDETIDQARISQAILAYLTANASGRSRYDAYAAGASDALTPTERRGLDLFRGKAECAACHRIVGSPARFTDNRFHHSNVGMERMSGNVKIAIEALQRQRQQGIPLAELVLSKPDIAALGRFAIDGRGEHLAAYRTPTLRNVSRTAPYMHDGSVPTLDAAIQREIYYRSLSRGTPITLTTDEQRDLRAFLFALEDTEESRVQPLVDD